MQSWGVGFSSLREILVGGSIGIFSDRSRHTFWSCILPVTLDVDRLLGLLLDMLCMFCRRPHRRSAPRCRQLFERRTTANILIFDGSPGKTSR